jgi:hypothetical protein
MMSEPAAFDPANRVEFPTENGVTAMRPSQDDEKPFAAFAGVLGACPGGVEDINAWVRDVRENHGRVNHLTPPADSDFL